MLLRMNASQILVLLSLLVLSSCSKKDKDETPQPATPNGNGNTNNTVQSYFSLTPGNVFYYSGDQGDYSMTVTNETVNFSGKTYKIGETVLDSSPNDVIQGYYRKEPNLFFQYIQEYGVELKMYDLNLPLNTTWTTSFNSNSYTKATYTFKVTGNGLTRTVNGVTYENVISVDLVTSWTFTQSYINQLLGVGFPQSAIDGLLESLASSNIEQTTYYAPEVGLIEQVSPMDGLNTALVRVDF